MNKGQIIAGDFMISIGVFVIILMILLPAWFYVSSQARNSEDRKNMELMSVVISDTMMKTQGYPENWTAQTVKTFGFADSERNLNISKIKEFKKIDYITAKKILGISNYNFYIEFYDRGYNLTDGIVRSPVAYFATNEIKIRDMLNGSGAVWDFYKGGASVSSEDARNYYNSDKVNAFNAMVDNQNNYSTIIIEDPELRGDEIDLDGLKNFVRMGGILIYKGGGWNGGIMIDDFGVSSSRNMETEGTVKNQSILLNATLGENITFTNTEWSFYRDSEYNDLNIIVAEKNDNTRCLICQWNYGFGNIYYIANTSGSVASRNLEDNMNIVGDGLVFGLVPSEKAEYVMSLQRITSLKTNGLMIVTMNVVLWL